MTYRKILLDALQEIRFARNELAYLALTSKLELQIRDRLAYQLFRRDLICAREWRRADLVILQNGTPRAVLEGKAAYTFDMLWPALGGYAAALRRDIRKAGRLAPDAEVFALISLTYVSGPVRNESPGLVKYARHLAARADYKTAGANLRAFLEGLGPTASRGFAGGRAFGVGVTVESWLCGPITRPKGRAKVPGGKTR